MFGNTRKLLLFVGLFLIIGQNAQAEKYDFEKEKELADKGYCEEALLENDKAIEYIIERNKNRKHYQDVFEVYRINRRIHILRSNCNKNNFRYSFGLYFHAQKDAYFLKPKSMLVVK